MKKYIIVIIALALFMSGCIVVQEPSSQEDIHAGNSQPTAIATAQPNAEDNSQPDSQNQDSQTEPVPEPTQQFIEETEDATAQINATSNPSSVVHDDIIGIWYLVVWNDVNIDSDLIFYEITQNMMNVLPYGTAPGGRDYNYSFNNGVVDFGDGNYDVIMDNGVLVLISQTTQKTCVFQPVSLNEIQSIVDSVNYANSSSGHIDNPAYAEGDNIIEHYDHTGIADIVVNSTWRTYAYLYADGTYTFDFLADETMNLYHDYTFDYFGAIAQYEGLYEVDGTTFAMYFSDGTQSYSSHIYVIENLTQGWWYLFCSDDDGGNPHNYIVYQGSSAP